MKKLLLLLLLIFLCSTLYSLESGFGLSLGSMSVGLNFDSGNTNTIGYIHGRILDFIFEGNTGLGFSISPVNFFYHYDEINSSSLTFINCAAYYNLLNNISKTIALKPFISVNAVKHDKLQFFELRSGLTFSISNSNNYNILGRADFLFLEVGYRYNNNNINGFFVQIGLDLISSLLYIGGETIFLY